jgi:hypothetical protein
VTTGPVDDDATVTADSVAPTITVVKTVDADGDGVFTESEEIPADGQVHAVDYRYELTNTSTAGDVDPLTIDSLIDDLGTADTGDDVDVTLVGSLVKTGGDQDDLLEVGETWTYTLTDVSLPGSTIIDSVVNTATVNAADDEGAPATDSDTATVTYFAVPSLADRLFINEISLNTSDAIQVGSGQNKATIVPAGGHNTGGLSYIEVLNNFNNAVGWTDLQQVDLEVKYQDANGQEHMFTIDFGSLTLGTIVAGVPQDTGTAVSGGSVISGNGSIIFYENGIWVTYNNNSIGQWGYYDLAAGGGDGNWSGLNDHDTADAIAANLIQIGSSIDLFVANGITIDGLTGVVELSTAGDFPSGFAPDPDLDALSAWRSGSAWFGHDSSGTFAAAVVGGAFLDNSEFNGNIGDQGYVLTNILDPDSSAFELLSDAGTLTPDPTKSTYVFARTYDQYIDPDSGLGSAADHHPIDQNQEDDWTITNSSTNTITPSGATKNNESSLNPQDSADNMNPLQGTTTSQNPRAGDDGQQVIYTENGGDYAGSRGPDFIYGDDHVSGNTLSGGSNNDFLFGGGGDDILNGGSGADLLIDVDGADQLSGGTGDDILITDAQVLKHYGDLTPEEVSSNTDVDDQLGDILAGGAGNDILIGGTGADAFVWVSGDQATGSNLPTDRVVGFDTVEDSDVLDLSELLEGANPTNEVLSNYMTFTSDGTNTTIDVKSLGNSGPGSGSSDQKIVLQGVDLVAFYGTNDSATIISNLISDGKLIV